MSIRIFVFCTILFVGLFVQKSSCIDSIESYCVNHVDCSPYQDKMVASHCVNERCKCFTVKNNSSAPCTPKNIIVSNMLAACKTSGCSIPNSRCDLTTTMCVCEDNFIESADKMRCIKASVQLGKSCEMSEQCVKADIHAECVNKTCDCKKNFTRHENSCRSVVNIGTPCQSDEECLKFTNNVTCINTHHCTCNKDFVASKDQHFCLPQYVNYLENCKETVQCTNGLGPGSICEEEKCKCDQRHRNITDKGKTICQRIVHYGDECKDQSDCSSYLDETTMVCSQYRCTCRNGYELYDAYQKRCVKTAEASSSTKTFPFSLVILIIFLVPAFVVFS